MRAHTSTNPKEASFLMKVTNAYIILISIIITTV